jgi:hypothetical protein
MAACKNLVTRMGIVSDMIPSREMVIGSIDQRLAFTSPTLPRIYFFLPFAFLFLSLKSFLTSAPVIPTYC